MSTTKKSPQGRKEKGKSKEREALPQVNKENKMTKYYIQKLLTLDGYSTRSQGGKNLYLIYQANISLLNDIQSLQCNLERALKSLDINVKGDMSLRQKGSLMHVIDGEELRKVWGQGEREWVLNIPELYEDRWEVIRSEQYELNKVFGEVNITSNWDYASTWVQLTYFDKDSRVWFQLLTDEYKTVRLELTSYLKEINGQKDNNH